LVAVVEIRKNRYSVEQATIERATANDVTAALMQLLRTQDITPEVFTCPATQPTKWDFGGGANTALNWSNWNGTAGVRPKLTYSYQNTNSTQSQPANVVQSGK
jgi:hypothetical protein